MTDSRHSTCPAWRNRLAPVDALAYKAFKAFFGDEYENVRILLENPDDPPPKGW
ncbi:hypothetical protein D9756_011021 [Leucocoprinus leucothites]|uniref:Uncharacterized protein n=1 Tax=Leucocoprinus leucothites TaxID=201217 RepID=A0A8H5CTV4_9AGAR|nr:hypothetical protein D9756_011021 [Leucoagaricus leucothites]